MGRDRRLLVKAIADRMERAMVKAMAVVRKKMGREVQRSLHYCLPASKPESRAHGTGRDGLKTLHREGVFMYILEAFVREK